MHSIVLVVILLLIFLQNVQLFVVTPWITSQRPCYAMKLQAKKDSKFSNDLIEQEVERQASTVPPPKYPARAAPDKDDDKLVFGDSGIDEQALRKSPFGKVFFKALDFFYPIFAEPNWYDVYDPPLTKAENMELPYFDGYDFVNSSWTIYIRHRYGAWNWLDRLGLVPQATQRVFLRPDGKTVWSDGYYGDWYINPAIKYFQIEKHFGRGFGDFQRNRGLRYFQVQSWNFEDSIGRYWQRGLRSYLRNETNLWALEGRVWGEGLEWRDFPRDQGKFIAIRDGANLTEIFGGEGNTPWEMRFRHSASLPFYQAHPDQLERIEDNFDMFYRNLLSEELR